MGGLLSGLNAGKSSLLASQKAIEVTGNNIANVNTPGYSRQTAVISPVPSVKMGEMFVGQGVRVDDVARATDSFLTRQVQAKAGDLGEQSARSIPLAEVERIFSVGESALAGEIGRFFDAWQELSANPAGVVERQQVLERGAAVTRAFQGMADDLENARQSLNQTMEGKLAPLNQKIKELAALNDRIRQIEMQGISAPSDRDRRDQLLEELSQGLGARYYERQDGMVDVFLPGGQPLVQGNQAARLVGSTVGGDLSVTLEMGGSRIATFPPAKTVGGEIHGLLELRDQFIPSLQADLDKLAFAFASAVDAEHAAGVGSDGVGGRAFFAPLAGEPGASRSLAVALTGAAQVAAGDSAAAGDNGGALRMTALEGAPLVGGSATFGDFYAEMAARVGGEVNQNRLASAGNEDALLQLRNLRDGTVGVSLEEEMVNLLRFQRNFEASAKFLATIDEMMESIISLKR